jgi:hypothetical protein
MRQLGKASKDRCFPKGTKMKKILAGVSMMLLMAVGALAAGQVKTPNCGYCGGASPNPTYQNYGLWQNAQGGEFTLIIVNSTDINLAFYSASVKNQGGTANSFQTFCVEENEYIYPNTTSDYTIGTAADNGGLNIGTGPAGTMNHPDELSMGTAWLYSNFAQALNFGGYASYNYANTSNGRYADAGDLQNALWFLENEVATISTSNKFYQAVKSFFADDANLTKARANALGAYGVRALNIYNPSSGEKQQTQLVFVPDAGFTAGLLGLGLSGLFVVSRKFRQN